MKRQFAIHGKFSRSSQTSANSSSDYKRTQEVLATCSFCYGEDDSPPKAPVVAMGTRTYLSCTLSDELVENHCLIVPIQHYLTMLEADDDVWDEVRVIISSNLRGTCTKSLPSELYEMFDPHVC